MSKTDSQTEFFRINAYFDTINQFDDLFFKKTEKKKNVIKEIDQFLGLNISESQNYRITSDISLVLPVLSEGLTFLVAERVFAKNNISICSKENF